MTYEIRMNEQFNSSEIYFDGKPSEAIRDALKALRFRWHSVKKCWYGYADADTVKRRIEAEAAETKATKKDAAPKTNAFGVKVGDIFHATWGWEQTNNNFFQVVALVGENSVRVREVIMPLLDSSAVSPMSEDRTFAITDELLPACSCSVFIKDQERGDIKRLKSYAADGKSEPLFKLSSFANAYYCSGDSVKVYESWYA